MEDLDGFARPRSPSINFVQRPLWLYRLIIGCCDHSPQLFCRIFSSCNRCMQGRAYSLIVFSFKFFFITRQQYVKPTVFGGSLNQITSLNSSACLAIKHMLPHYIFNDQVFNILDNDSNMRSIINFDFIYLPNSTQRAKDHNNLLQIVLSLSLLL